MEMTLIKGLCATTSPRPPRIPMGNCSEARAQAVTTRDRAMMDNQSIVAALGLIDFLREVFCP